MKKREVAPLASPGRRAGVAVLAVAGLVLSSSAHASLLRRRNWTSRLYLAWFIVIVF